MSGSGAKTYIQKMHTVDTVVIILLILKAVSPVCTGAADGATSPGFAGRQVGKG